MLAAMSATAPTPESTLLVPDVAAWRAWLDAHEDASDGIWLVLAKKGTVTPTSLTYAQALDESLCSGWIDGQKRSRDDTTFIERFTPRRPRSMWSLRNTEHIERLRAEGRMRPRGEREVELAMADGRWDRAYAGSAAMEVPPELAVALAANPDAASAFEGLTRAGRYSVLHPIVTAASAETRDRRIAKAVAALAAG